MILTPLGLSDKISTMRMTAENQAIHEFYCKISKEDKISYDEAVELCKTDPKYSLGLKIQIFMVRSTFDLRHKKMHLREMIDSLSPEELEIYNAEVKGLKLRKMVENEVRKRIKI